MNYWMGRWVVGALWAGLLAACSGIDTQVEPRAGFRAGDYRNYAWATPPLAESRDPQLLKIDRVVRASVDDELRKRGFVAVPKAQAAGLVDYRIASQMDVSQGGGTGSPRDDAARAVDLNTNVATDVSVHNHPILPYLQRMELVLSIQEQRSGNVVWQGSASKAIDNANPGEQFSTADIQRAVGMVLEQMKDSDK